MGLRTLEAVAGEEQHKSRAGCGCRNSRGRSSRPFGFTLVEMQIVAGLIVLLAAIAVPNYIRARITSQQKGCIRNLVAIRDAIDTWAMENRASASTEVNQDKIRPFLKGAVVCPAGGKAFANSYEISTVAEPPTCLKSPSTHLLTDSTLEASQPENPGKGHGKGHGQANGAN